MKTNANGTASLEPSTHAADFAQRVNVNEAKLTSELRPHYDFIVCGFGLLWFGGSAPASRKSKCHRTAFGSRSAATMRPASW
jgi:hypothetical protein